MQSKNGKELLRPMYGKALFRAGRYLCCMVLIAAMALTAAGCGGSETPSGSEMPVHADGSILGEGGKEFDLVVVDKDGGETRLEIHTDRETVGEALLELGLIAGEEGEYGLYVKTVNGISADYEKDGVYWAFYVDGEYASAGVDAVSATPGTVYSFKVE